MLQRTIDSLFGRKPRKKTVMWIQDHLPDVKLPALGKSRSALDLGVGMNSPLWPTFIAAAGAGAAFWWWTQWARGRAEIEAREATAIAEGEHHPETVMAHASEPAPSGSEPSDPSDAELTEPAEVIMAHSPSQGAGLGAGLSDRASDVVDESLGVQGAPAAKPRAPRKSKGEIVPAATH